MEVKQEPSDFHEKSVKIKQEPEFVDLQTPIKVENHDWDIETPPTRQIPKVKEEPQDEAEYMDDIREVKATDYFVSNSDLVNIKLEPPELVDPKPELLTTHCDLPSLKSENDYNEPCSSKPAQETLQRAKQKKSDSRNVIKKKKMKYPCPICKKSGTCKETCINLSAVSDLNELQTNTDAIVPAENKKIYLANIKFILPYIMKNVTSPQCGKIPIILQESQGESADKNYETADTSSVRLESYPSISSELQRQQNRDDTIVNASSVQLEWHTSSQASGSKRKQYVDEPDRSLMLYKVRHKRPKPVVDDLRKMFLISLLDEVNKMSYEQMKSFKRKVLLLIDQITAPTTAYLHQFQSDLQQPCSPISQSAISCIPDDNSANTFSNF